MENVIYGLLAIVVGALLCFRGSLAFRLIMPVWGAFAGFTFGASLVASVSNSGFLATAMAWIIGLGCALVFALLAYLYYEVAVTIAMGSIGFMLGASMIAALDISWTWLIVLAGLAVGGLLAAAAVAANLPMVLLVVLSALGGASAIVTGVMLLAGTLNIREFSDGAVTSRIDNGWWFLLYLGLALAGAVAQGRASDRLRMSMRESWTLHRASA